MSDPRPAETEAPPPADFLEQLFADIQSRGAQRDRELAARNDRLFGEHRRLLRGLAAVYEREVALREQRQKTLEAELAWHRAQLGEREDELGGLREARDEGERERRRLFESLRALEHELADLRLQRSVTDTAQADGGGTRRVLAELQRLGDDHDEVPEDDTSVASPAYRAFDVTDKEGLAYQLSVVEAERDELRLELRTMEEILEGAEYIPAGAPAPQPDPGLAVRERAAEETARSLSYLLTRSAIDEAARAPQATAEAVAEERERWRSREQGYDQSIAELEERCVELEEAIATARQEEQRLREEATSAITAHAALEIGDDQGRIHLEEQRLRAEAARRERDEVRAELERLRASFQEELRSWIEQASEEWSAAAVAEVDGFDGDVGEPRGDFELMRRAWQRARGEAETRSARILKEAEKGLAAPGAVRPDALVHAAAHLRLEIDQVRARLEAATALAEAQDQRLRGLTEERAAAEQAVDDKVASLDRSEDAFARRFARLASLEAALAHDLPRLQAAEDERAAAAELQRLARLLLGEREEDLESSTRSLDVVARERRELSESLEGRLLDLASLEEQVARCRAEFPDDGERLGHFEERRGAVATHVESLQSALELAREAEDEARQLRRDLESSSEETRREHAEARRSLSEIDQRLERLRRRVDETRAELAQSERDRGVAREQRSAARRELVAACRAFEESRLLERNARLETRWRAYELAELEERAGGLAESCGRLVALLEAAGTAKDPGPWLIGELELFLGLDQELGGLVEQARSGPHGAPGELVTDRAQVLDGARRLNARLRARRAYQLRILEDQLARRGRALEAIERRRQQGVDRKARIGSEFPELEAELEELERSRSAAERSRDGSEGVERDDAGRRMEDLAAEIAERRDQRDALAAESAGLEEELAGFEEELSQRRRDILSLEQRRARFMASLELQELAREELASISADQEGGPGAALRAARDEEEVGQSILEDRLFSALWRRRASDWGPGNDGEIAPWQVEYQECERRYQIQSARLEEARESLESARRDRSGMIRASLFLDDQSRFWSRRLAELEGEHGRDQRDRAELERELSRARDLLKRERERLLALERDLERRPKTPAPPPTARISGAWSPQNPGGLRPEELELLNDQLRESEERREAIADRLQRSEKESRHVIERLESRIAELSEAEGADSKAAPQQTEELRLKDREILKLRSVLETERKRNEGLASDLKRLKAHVAGEQRRRDTRGLRPEQVLSEAPPLPREAAALQDELKRVRSLADQRSHRIEELESHLHRAESRASDLAKTMRFGRQRRTKTIARLRQLERGGGQVGDLARLEIEMEALERKLREESSRREKVEESSRSKLEQLMHELREAERRLKERSEQVGKLEREVAARETRALTSTAEVVRLGRELEETRSSLADKERSLREANHKLEDHQARVGALQRELAGARDQAGLAEERSERLREIEQGLDEARAEAAEAKRQMQAMADSLEAERAQRDQLASAVAEAEQRSEALSAELAETDERSAQRVAELQQLRQELDSARGSLEERERRLSEAQSSLAEKSSAVGALERRLDEARSRYEQDREAARAEVAAIEGQLGEARDEVRRRSEEIRGLSELVESDKRLHGDLERTAGFARELVERMVHLRDLFFQSQRDTAQQAEKRSSLRRRLGWAESRVLDLNRRLRELEAEGREIRLRGEQATLGLEELSRERRELDRLADSAAPPTDLEARLRAHNIDKDRSEQRLTTLTAEYESNRDSYSKLSLELREAQGETDRLRRDLSEFDAVLAEAESSADSLSRDLQETWGTLKELSAGREDLEDELLEVQVHPDLQREVDLLQEALESERLKREDAKQYVSEVADRYQDELSRLCTELVASREALEQRQSQLSGAKDRIEQSEQRVKELSEQIQDDKAELSEAEEAFVEASQRYAERLKDQEAEGEASRFPGVDATIGDVELEASRLRMETLRAAIDAKDEALEKAEEEAQVQRELAQSLEAALAQALEQAAEATESAQAARAQSASQEFVVSELTAGLERAQHELEDTQKSREELEGHVGGLSSQIEELRETLEDAQEASEDRAATIAQLEARLEELQGLTAQEDREAVARFEQELGRARAEAKEHKLRCDEVEAALRATEERSRQSQRQVDEVRARFEEESQRVAALTEERDQARARAEAIEKTVAELRKESAARAERTRELEVATAAARAEQAAREGETKETRRLLEERERRGLELESRLAEHTRLLEEHDAELARREAELAAAQDARSSAESELGDVRGTLSAMAEEIAALRLSLTSAEDEVRVLRERVHGAAHTPAGGTPTRTEAPAADLLHWIIKEDHPRTLTPSSDFTPLLAHLRQRMHWLEEERAQAQDDPSLGTDTRSLWASMKTTSQLNEIEDLLSWISAEHPLHLAFEEVNGELEEPPMLAAIEEEERERLELQEEVVRLESALDRARREQAATERFEAKLDKLRARLDELNRSSAERMAFVESELSSEQVSSEFLEFYEKQVEALRCEIEELRESKRKIEREAWSTLELLDTEKSELRRELESTRERLEDLDQVIITLQAASPKTQVETLIHEQAELRRGLREKTEQMTKLERAQKEREATDTRKLEESRLTIDRLQGLLEKNQDSAGDRIAALEAEKARLEDELKRARGEG